MMGAPAAPSPGLSRQAQAALTSQQAARFGPQQGTQQTQQTQPEAAGLPPRASEVRRKRITPPPVTEQPVGAPTPAQNIPGQPQTQ